MPHFDCITPLCEVRSLSSSDQSWRHGSLVTSQITASFHQKGGMSRLRTFIKKTEAEGRRGGGRRGEGTEGWGRSDN